MMDEHQSLCASSLGGLLLPGRGRGGAPRAGSGG
jgi:hypothetical protein